MQNITRIYALSKRNIILRYKNSIAGFLWGFFKPLLYLLIFIIVFSSQVSTNNYVLYATSGLVFWFFFANVTNQSIASIISSTGIIKSINVPVIYFPLSETISELFNLVLTLVVFFIAMKWFGIVYSFKLFLIIPCALLFAIFSFGLTLILCSLNVFFRDVGILWTTVQPALFYLTPIAYPKEMITKHYPLVVKLNPIYYFIDMERMIVHENIFPPVLLWAECMAIAGVMFVLGYLVFNKLKQQFISAI
ncbi:MAG: ABC transporter permease [Taibaiella sp.]|nr:ABC transporter permease [Taibaiella sp.]